MRTQVRRAGFLKLQGAVVSVLTPAIALVIDAAAHAGGTPAWTGSTANITHNPGTPGGSSFNDSTFPIPSGTAALAAPFNPHVDNFTVGASSVNSNASAGMSHSESATSAQISFASGTGVSQTDPNHVQGPSTLDVQFLTEWNVPSNGFGAPVSGSFSMPYGAKIGPNGSASISIVVNWDVINGAVETPLKNYTVNTTTYKGGTGGSTVLTSFTAPTTLFSPSSFTGGEVLVIQGDVTFTADNNNGPTISEIPTAADFGLSTTSPFLQPATMGGIISANLTWSANANGNWDTVTPNFINTGSVSVFNTGDNVTFDDTSSQPNVSINSPVSPGSMTVNNSVLNYTFSGAGSIIGGGTLTKNGTGTVTLSTSNTYVGGTTLNAGTLNINNNSALGTGTFTIAGGTIDNTSGAPIVLSTNNTIMWSGDFTFGGSGPLNLGTGPVVLTGNRTVTVNGTAGVLTVDGPILGFGGLTKTGPGILVLGGANTYTGPTQILAGTLLLASSSTTGISNESLSGGLNISTGTTVQVIPAASHGNRILLTLGGLSFSGASGLLNLANNDMDLQSGSLSSTISEIAQAYVGGKWTGAGGITSSSAANDTTHLTTLGVIENTNDGVSQLYGSSGPLGLFDGANPAPTDLLVKFTYYGDTNLDGKIDGSDYARIDNGFLTRATTWNNGDFNYDGTVNGSDYTLIDNAFNSQGASLAGSIADPTAAITSQVAGGSSVPEPSTLGIVAIASIGALKRRRSR